VPGRIAARLNRDVIAGAVFLSIGLIVLVSSQDLKLGTASRMGPGYFPTVLGWLLLALGAVIAATGWTKGAPGWTWARPRSYFVLLGVLLFAAFLGWGSYWLAMIALLAVGALAAFDLSLRAALASMAIIIVGCYIIFVRGLEVNLPMWPL